MPSATRRTTVVGLAALGLAGCSALWIEYDPDWGCQDPDERQGWCVDTGTGEMWQNPADEPQFISGAGTNEYCNDLEWDGFTDWRLPTKDELKSLMAEEAHAGCAWKPGLRGECGLYWSASADGGNTWYVSFNNSYVGSGLSTMWPGSVRCLRSAGGM